MKPVVQKVVVGGVMIHNGKALIVQRAANEEILPNQWELPSGKKEPLEKAINALVREFKEETGLGIKVDKPIGVMDYGWEKEDEIRDAVQINFLVKPIGKLNIKLSDEHQSFAWISEEEIENYDMSDEIKKTIKEAFAQ